MGALGWDWVGWGVDWVGTVAINSSGLDLDGAAGGGWLVATVCAFTWLRRAVDGDGDMLNVLAGGDRSSIAVVSGRDSSGQNGGSGDDGETHLDYLVGIGVLKSGGELVDSEKNGRPKSRVSRC